MGWLIGVVVVVALVVVGLAMAQSGQSEAKAFAEGRGWRYDKTGVETFRISGREEGRDSSGDWILTYGRSESADASKNLAFEFAVPSSGDAMMMSRTLFALLHHGVTGAVARGLNALPGSKAGIALEGEEAPIDWIRSSGFSQQYALVGDPAVLRSAIDENIAVRLMTFSSTLIPTISAKHRRCRVLVNVRTTPQALGTMPDLVELGRAMVAAANT